MLKKWISIILMFLDDIFLISGIALISFAAFLIGLIVGLVTLGIFLIVLAMLIGRRR
ncbi:hypothetical protein [Macrococcus sp. PK]|uniref:hypothetical protein n=1 Tax=Macrococcus sp. PK TaxID=2801919 RepID=UPI001F10FD26|nr:hypothetical protein [Macrococcus sp. PK]